MELGDLALGIYVTILSTGMTVLPWARLNGIEEKLEPKAEKDDVALVRTELAGLRSDLTQAALAVGGDRPRADE